MGHTKSTFNEKVATKLTGNTAKNFQAIHTDGAKLNFEAISLKLAMADRKVKFADLLPKVKETLHPLYEARGQVNGEWTSKRFTIYTKIAIKQRTAIIAAEKDVREASKKEKAPKAEKKEVVAEAK